MREMGCGSGVHDARMTDDARDLQLARSERRRGESEGVVTPDCGECCGDGKVIIGAGVGVEV